MTRLIVSFLIIFSALATGYGIQHLVKKNRLHLPFSLHTLRKSLQKIALLFFLPITVLGAIWIVDIGSARIVALPFIGFGALFLGGMLALLMARMLKLKPRQTGALFTCGSFTNIGSIGALICYMFLGEEGFALVPVYKILEEVSYYSIGFPIAKYYSTMDSTPESAIDRVKSLARDPFIRVAVSSLTIGGFLNAAGVSRPDFFKAVNAVFIPVGTSLLLISIGLAMRFKSVRDYLKECAAVSAIKFMMVPVVMSTIAFLIGFGDIDGGLPLKVVIILTSMPVAFNALIPPSIYDLDLDLANSCWFFSTSALIVILPILLTIINLV
jgi:predicted permease